RGGKRGQGGALLAHDRRARGGSHRHQQDQEQPAKLGRLRLECHRTFWRVRRNPPTRHNPCYRQSFPASSATPVFSVNYTTTANPSTQGRCDSTRGTSTPGRDNPAH